MSDLIKMFAALVIYVLCVGLCIMSGVMLGSAIGGDPSPCIGIGGISGVIGGIFLGRKVVGLIFFREEKEELKTEQQDNLIHNTRAQAYHDLGELKRQDRISVNIKKEEKHVTHALRLQIEISELLSEGKVIHPGYLSFNLMEEGLRMADIQTSPNGIYTTTRYICPDGSFFGVIQDKNKVVMVKECHPN